MTISNSRYLFILHQTISNYDSRRHIQTFHTCTMRTDRTFKLDVGMCLSLFLSLSYCLAYTVHANVMRSFAIVIYYME